MSDKTSRRTILRSVAMIPVAFAFSGCEAITKTLTTENIQKLLDNFSTITDAVRATKPVIDTIDGITSGVRATVDTVMADLKAAKDEIKSLFGGSSDKTLVQRLESGVSKLTAALSGYKLPEWVKTVYDDVMLVLPLMQTAVGILVPMAGNPGDMTAAMARLRRVVATAIPS